MKSMTNEKEKGRVIVTYGRSLIALMIAQSLGTRGVEVIGCDSVGMTVLSFSKFVAKTAIYASPYEDEEQFIDDLVEIVRKNKPDDKRPYVLIPAFDDAAIVAKYKERFAGLVTVACPDYDAISSVTPKDNFAKTMQALAVESPQTWMPEDKKALAEVIDEIEFPVFIKPPDDVGGRGVSKVTSKDQLQEAFVTLQKRYPDEQIIIQALAKGVDYCFCGLFDQGALVASMVYHNIRKFPKEAGPGVVRETVESEQFDALAAQLMEPLKWHGVVEIDFMWDDTGSDKPMMIEVNPRFWAGLDHSIKSNIDFPWLLYQLFTNGKADATGKANVGHQTSLPGLSTMARVEHLFSAAVNFEDLEAQWPEIKQHLKARDLREAGQMFKDALHESISFDEAISVFQSMLEESRKAEKISYAKDDPFIGLGVLFILAFLIKHGTLPPEITR